MSRAHETLYLPIQDADVLLEGCSTLLRSMVQRIIEKYINGRTNYTNEANVVRVKVVQIVIDYQN